MRVPRLTPSLRAPRVPHLTFGLTAHTRDLVFDLQRALAPAPRTPLVDALNLLFVLLLTAPAEDVIAHLDHMAVDGVTPRSAADRQVLAALVAYTRRVSRRTRDVPSSRLDRVLEALWQANPSIARTWAVGWAAEFSDVAPAAPPPRRSSRAARPRRRLSGSRSS